MSKKFKQLLVPEGYRHYWSKYPEGYTILEALLNWVDSVNQLTENVNDWNIYLDDFVENFDEKLRPTVREMLNEMEQDGRLADIINEEIFSYKVDRDNMDDIAISVNFLGADSNNTDNTTPIKNAIQEAKDKQTSVAFSGDLTVTSSVPEIHDVSTIGVGSITRGTDTWYITPNDTQTNTIYVSDDYLETHDGITRDKAVSVSKAIDIIRKLGDKASNGNWELLFIGNINQNGVQPFALPAFKNRLKFKGERDVYGNITSVINGSETSSVYWFRADIHAGTKFYEFENLKFTNWDGQTNAGALVIWEEADVYIHDCEFKDCSRGAWLRNGRFQVDDCIFDTGRTLLGLQYHATFNVSRNTFLNSNSNAVHIGRNSAGHIRENIFDSCNVGIDVAQSSRLRTITNTHKNWVRRAIEVSLNATHEMADGEEEIIETGSMDRDHSFKTNFYGGLDPRLTIGTGVGVHQIHFPTSPHAINVEDGEVNLSGVIGRILYVPNSFLLKQASFINIKIPVILYPNTATTFTLSNGVPGGDREAFSFDIENGNTNTRGNIEIDIYPMRKGSNIGYYFVKYPHSEKGVEHIYGTLNFPNVTGVDYDLNRINWRLYADVTSGNSTVIVGVVTTLGEGGY